MGLNDKRTFSFSVAAIQIFDVVMYFFVNSPRGERVRSRVELISLMVGQQDMSTFDYKSGKFYEGEVQPVRIRHRARVRAFFIA